MSCVVNADLPIVGGLTREDAQRADTRSAQQLASIVDAQQQPAFQGLEVRADMPSMLRVAMQSEELVLNELLVLVITRMPMANLVIILME